MDTQSTGSNRVHVIVQARSSSTRLPGKSLLTIGGLPLAVLVAKRASNTGYHVILATSNDRSDDYLASIVQSYGIECFRGDLIDVRSRYIAATSHYSPSDILVRLTADNPIPDGYLIRAVLQEFIHRGLDYICCNGMNSGLPYGCSVEIMYISALRSVSGRNLDSYDREHVTPAVIRSCGLNYFTRWEHLQLGGMRTTVDTLDDYLTVAQMFEEVGESITTSSYDILLSLGKNLMTDSIPEY